MKKLFKFFKDWSWFLFVLKRNEFHHSLELDVDKAIASMRDNTIKDYNIELINKRNLANDLDNQWTDFCIKVKKILDLPRIFK